MSRRAKGPRLYLDPERKQWVIRDGSRFVRTGCGERSRAAAEKLLEQYLGRKHKPEASGAPMIADVLRVYSDEVAQHRKSARNLSYIIEALLTWWGDKRADQVSKATCRAYADTRPSQAAASQLKILRAALRHWHQSPEYGPLKFTPVIWMPTANPPRDRWLTREEAARLLRAAKPYPHLRRMILLGLYTGSRPGVLLALHWSQVDLKGRMLARTPIGKAQDAKKRAPKVRLGRRILAHLTRWQRIDGPKAEYVCAYEDAKIHGPRRVVDPHSSWDKVVAASGLQGVTRHTLRHTRATWMMQAGVPIWEAAGFLGMTVKTLERVYGHHDPDHQERAANV